MSKRVSLQLTWEEALSRNSVAAIRKWVGIVLCLPSAFDLGRKLSRSLPLGAALHGGLKEVFAGRAAGTLHNRAGPILRYIGWCRAQGEPPFPVEEQLAYRFMKAAEASCSPTFLRSFVVSMCFCHHVLGLLGAESAANSMRVRGAAQSMYLLKRKKVQKPPFTAKMVSELETFVCRAADSSKSNRVRDAILAGFFLILAYMRARYSDGLQLCRLVLDIPEGQPDLPDMLKALRRGPRQASCGRESDASPDGDAAPRPYGA